MTEIIKKLQYIESQIKDPILAGQVREVEYLLVYKKDEAEFCKRQIEAMNMGVKALHDDKDLLYKLVRENKIALPCKLSCHYGNTDGSGHCECEDYCKECANKKIIKKDLKTN